MINLSLHREQFDRAMARARKTNVQAQELISDGHLVRVTSASIAGRWHLVELHVKGSDVLASCDCPAGQAHLVCHHVAAAAELMMKKSSFIEDEITCTEIDVD